MGSVKEFQVSAVSRRKPPKISANAKLLLAVLIVDIIGYNLSAQRYEILQHFPSLWD